MRILMLSFIVLLAACSSSKKTSEEASLTCVNAFSQYVVGGKEKLDGTTSKTHYQFIFENYQNVASFTNVWIHGEAYAYESFEYENQFYVTVSIYGDNTDNQLSIPQPSFIKNPFVLEYSTFQSKLQYFVLDSVKVKASVKGN